MTPISQEDAAAALDEGAGVGDGEEENGTDYDTLNGGRSGSLPDHSCQRGLLVAKELAKTSEEEDQIFGTIIA